MHPPTTTTTTTDRSPALTNNQSIPFVPEHQKQSSEAKKRGRGKRSCLKELNLTTSGIGRMDIWGFVWGVTSVRRGKGRQDRTRTASQLAGPAECRAYKTYFIFPSCWSFFSCWAVLIFLFVYQRWRCFLNAYVVLLPISSFLLPWPACLMVTCFD